MNCPNCGTTLLMTERNKIEIDYCPSCRGVWLDRGELDKILEHGSQNLPEDNREDYEANRKNPGRYSKDQQQGYKKPYKKSSFLSDLFDFG